jgi:hypothetical protein
MRGRKPLTRALLQTDNRLVAPSVLKSTSRWNGPDPRKGARVHTNELFFTHGFEIRNFGFWDEASRCVGDRDLICSVWNVVWCHVQRVHGLESRGSGLPAVDRLADLLLLDVGRSADNVEDLEAQDNDVLRVKGLGFRVEG